MLRLRLSRLLELQELSVGEIARVLQLPQSTISRHLKVLDGAGWLSRRSEGPATFYRLSIDDLPADAASLWGSIRAQVDQEIPLAEDRRRLERVLAERRTDSQAYFGRVAGEWDLVRTTLFGSHFAARALLALLPPDWRIADLGCGTGLAAGLMAPYIREVLAVDHSGPMLEEARKHLAGHANIEFLQAPLEALPLADGAVDAATCQLVLHHVAEPLAVLQEMRRIVRPGGVALVVDMVEHDRTAYRHSMGHLHLGFSRDRIGDMMQAAGFALPRIELLPPDPDAKGPELFLARATVPR